MPLILGALAVGSGVIGAFGSAGQAKAQAAAQELQQRQANFQNQWQNEAANRNLMRQWRAQLAANVQIEKAANEFISRQNYYSKEQYNNVSSELSRQTKQVTDSFLSTASARGMNINSATAKAMLRKATEDSRKSSENLKVNYQNQLRDLENQYGEILNKRVLGDPNQTVFLPTTGGIVDSSSNMLMTGLATSLLSGASATIGAARQQGGSFKPSFKW